MAGHDEGGSNTWSADQLQERVDHYTRARIGAGDDPSKTAFLLRGMLLEISVLAENVLTVELRDSACPTQAKVEQIKTIADLAFTFAAF